MDVVRKKPKTGKWLRWTFLLIVIGAGIAATTSGLSNLKPALPEFDRAPVIFDTVQRGTLIREVRGSGTLVPVDITWVTTEVGGQVTEVLIEPGVEVTQETVILKLHDPQMERAVREEERSLTLAQADVERFTISQKSTELDLKVATATSRANFEKARLQSELHDRLSLRGLISPRQARQSRDKADRSRMLMEVQIERVVNSKKTQELQYKEKLAWAAGNAAQETGMLRANISLAKDFEPVLHWWFFTITREQGGSKWLRQKVANGLGNSSPG